MFLTSGVSYYSVPLKGLQIHTKSGKIIDNANIKIRLLSFADLSKLEMLRLSNVSESDIYEEICSKCILGVLYYEDEEIDLEQSPAGIVQHIGLKVLYHSQDVIKDLEQTYNSFMNTITTIDGIQAKVAFYTNTQIDVVRDYGVDRLIRDYAILSTVFSDVPPIVKAEPTESKVGE